LRLPLTTVHSKLSDWRSIMVHRWVVTCRKCDITFLTWSSVFDFWMAQSFSSSTPPTYQIWFTVLQFVNEISSVLGNRCVLLVWQWYTVMVFEKSGIILQFFAIKQRGQHGTNQLHTFHETKL
jgi:hypothetical protein